MAEPNCVRAEGDDITTVTGVFLTLLFFFRACVCAKFAQGMMLVICEQSVWHDCSLAEKSTLDAPP